MTDTRSARLAAAKAAPITKAELEQAYLEFSGQQHGESNPASGLTQIDSKVSSQVTPAVGG